MDSVRCARLAAFAEAVVPGTHDGGLVVARGLGDGDDDGMGCRGKAAWAKSA